MHSDTELEDDDNHRSSSTFKLERFLDQSHVYFKRLSELKLQLNEINRTDQPDVYIHKLNEITTLAHDLTANIRHIEHLHTQLSENERLTLDHQIYRLRNEIDRELNEFHRLREQMITSSSPETASSIHSTTNDPLEENRDIPNELRQRHTTRNRVNDTYDLLEQDLAVLRETIDEVATLVAHQEEALTRTQQLTNLARSCAHHVSSFFQRAVHNRYVTITSGALVGALVGGPVGFVMGTKIGALVALTGSAVGALSMNIMQQRVAEASESAENTTAYNQAML